MAEIIVNSAKSKADFLAEMERQYEKHGFLRLTIKTGKQRSSKENRALHKYCELLAEALNDAGYDVQKTMRHDVEVPWSAVMVKELLWRKLQEAVIGQKSTAKAKRAEYSKVYDVLNRYLIERLGVYVPWPHIEDR